MWRNKINPFCFYYKKVKPLVRPGDLGLHYLAINPITLAAIAVNETLLHKYGVTGETLELAKNIIHKLYKLQDRVMRVSLLKKLSNITHLHLEDDEGSSGHEIEQEQRFDGNEWTLGIRYSEQGSCNSDREN